MATPVAKGIKILIPLFDGQALGPPITLKWQQDMGQRQEAYYQVTADNIDAGMSPTLCGFKNETPLGL